MRIYQEIEEVKEVEVDSHPFDTKLAVIKLDSIKITMSEEAAAEIAKQILTKIDYKLADKVFDAVDEAIHAETYNIGKVSI